MLQPTSHIVSQALRTFAKLSPLQLTEIPLPGSSVGLLAIKKNTKFYVFANFLPETSLDAAKQVIRQAALSSHLPLEVSELLIVPENGNFLSTETAVVGLGIQIIPLHDAIAMLVDLPAGWKRTQDDFISKNLTQVKFGNEYRLASTKIQEGEISEDATRWCASKVTGWSGSKKNCIVYFRGEAGRGKSTLAARVVENSHQEGTGPLPLLIPMRFISRAEGMSLSSIFSPLGTVDHNSLIAAVKARLVIPFFDGLDEVSGRYEPTLIKSIVDAVLAGLLSENSVTVFTGRTTESTMFSANAKSVSIHDIELPEASDPDFKQYTKIVVDSAVPAWWDVGRRIPEPPVQIPKNQPADPTETELQQISAWIGATFEDLGKERSLFFVQSLAFLARARQVDGNQPLFIKSQSTAKLASARIYDVCIIAAAVATVREQEKVEIIAKSTFRPGAQLDFLTWIAARDSAYVNFSNKLPTPNDLAKTAFDIDPINRNEEFTAIVRQMQKHALLLAKDSESLRAGDWQPAFLSDWIRGALLVRAWLNRSRAPVSLNRSTVSSAVACAPKGRNAFGIIFPSLTEEQNFDVQELALVLVEQSTAGSTEASANYWHLAAGIRSKWEMELQDEPKMIEPLTDLSGFDASDFSFGSSFSGDSVLLIDSTFEECTFNGTQFNDCDFQETTFISCSFKEVIFNKLFGPAYFEECTFDDCSWIDSSCNTLPALIFENCAFRKGCIIRQEKAPANGAEYGPIVSFVDCTRNSENALVLSGAFLGIEPAKISGLANSATAESNPVEACLRSMLKPFFPRRAGEQGQIQARPYIRLSSLGRGARPTDAPSQSDMFSILQNFGFTDGGRENHVYGPWSSVAGSSSEGIKLRNECVNFLRSGKSGPNISDIKKVLKKTMMR